MARHRSAAAGGAADPVRPAMLPDQLEALRVVDQGGEVHQGRGGHGHHRVVRESSINRLQPPTLHSTGPDRPPRNPTRASPLIRQRPALLAWILLMALALGVLPAAAFGVA